MFDEGKLKDAVKSKIGQLNQTINQEPIEYFNVNNRVLRKDKILAEGGFGFVYKVTDEADG